jgi:hypothetical protein
MENSILAFLQAIFSAFPEGTTPRSYHYDDRADVTEIDIEGQNTDNLKNVDVRPKITVARGPVSWMNSHINNFVGSRNLSVDSRTYAAVDRGTVGISCFSQNDLEADQIAHICYSSIRGFGPILQRLGYLSIKAAQVGQRGMIRSDSKPVLFVTPVLVQVEITSQWKSRTLDPINLRKILVESIIIKP